MYLVIIDDSNGQGYEEEEVYYEEEPEENFNHLSNQGKLTLATYYSKLILALNPSKYKLDLQDYPLDTQTQFY